MLRRALFPTFFAAALLTGCASPGLPHAPSLNLPARVQNLTAERVGTTVVLHFTAPHRTTDNLPLKLAALGLKVCRELPPATICTPIPQLPNSISTTNPQGSPSAITLTDTLPTALTTGTARLLAYRVEVLNDRARSVGPSDAAYTVAGTAPAPVESLTAAGSRLGVLLTWSAAPADDSPVLLHRDIPDAKSAPLLLRASEDATASLQNRTLDTSAEDGTTYRYTAFRQRKVTLGGRTLTLRSDTTAPIVFTLRDTFPPPVPTDLTVAPFSTDGKFSVDLIWQPVEDPGLAGYNAYREDPTTHTRTRLNSAPLTVPAFHDTTAAPGTGYRYAVTSLDRKGNESGAVTATVAASAN